MKNPSKTYTHRKNTYNRLLRKQNKRINNFSNLRLIIALAGILHIAFLYTTKNYPPIYYLLPIYIAVFAFLVISYNRVKKKGKYTAALHQINTDALQRIRGYWKDFLDTGAEFQDDSHSFSSDLDIFGQGSLFQYINTTTTSMGRQALRKYLTRPCKDKEQITDRQEAINELADKLEWRQEFMAEGLMASHKSKRNNESLYKYVEFKDEVYTKPWLIIGTNLLPIITIVTILLYIAGLLVYQVPVVALAIQSFLLIFKNKERSAKLNLVYEYKESIQVYSKMLAKLEKANFESTSLIEMQSNLTGPKKRTASQKIKKLEKITDNISNRSNLAFIILNVLFLWDYRCMIALERWKGESGIQIKSWLETIGDFEGLASLANLRYDNPDWAVAEILDDPYLIKAKDVGHPLLTDERVCNDLEIDDLTKVLLITGSNMSGKSTYLRTAGINLVLAYAGAPVCAKDFECSLFNIYTCMRVSDNLEKNTSSFYAELLRIKEIVDSSQKENTFFLLDEVFKGTNSHDRHEGAKILINKLLDNKAVGLVSTHDLELEVLENESGKQIRNYHFKEYYENNKIHFDYKLRPGISTTSNAMYLIKMIGIDD